jgi:hypothetical protein
VASSLPADVKAAPCHCTGAAAIAALAEHLVLGSSPPTSAQPSRSTREARGAWEMGQGIAERKPDGRQPGSHCERTLAAAMRLHPPGDLLGIQPPLRGSGLTSRDSDG